MGHDSSKELSASEVEKFKNSTNFSGKEIQEWHKNFTEDFPGGHISMADFEVMSQKMFPDGDASQFAQQIFRTYDMDNNGVIDFREFLTTMSVLSKGDMDEKLKWSFRLYDKDGSGYISRNEAIDIIHSIFKMKGESNCLEKATELAEHIFIELDRNKDDMLSEMEFVQAAKQSKSIQTLLQGV